jgi:D-ribose pyranose/furanose isomerase RbsD
MNMSFANGLNAPIFQFIFERLINFHLAQVIHSIEVFDVINKLGEGLSIPIENEAITLILEKSIIKGKNIILVVECPSQE